jgi:hypothetical protein
MEMELENMILSEVRLRRSKITCSPSYAYYRYKTNAVILLDRGHSLRVIKHGRDRERKGNLIPEWG